MAEQQLRANIVLNDEMTGALKNITRSMNIVINTMDDIRRSSGRAFNSSSINSARGSIAQVEATLRNVQRQTQNNANAQRQHNNELKEASGHAETLLGKIAGIVGTYIGLGKIKDMALGLAEQSDNMAQTNSRLSMMNDGQRTTLELQNEILNMSSRTKTEYGVIADLVGKIGINSSGVFANTQEILDFSEQIAKHMKITGTNSAEANGAMLQLNQAMASGTLRGEELNSIMDAMPTVIQAIADEMGVPRGQIKKLAEEGKITADIVKKALLNSVDETNEKFSQIPQTFSGAWMEIKNKATQAFQPVFGMLSRLANSSAFQSFASMALRTVQIVANGLLFLGGIVQIVAGFVQQHWGVFKYVFGALAVLIGVVLVASCLAGIQAVWGLVSTLVAGAITAVTAWLPVLWPIVLLGILIAGVIIMAKQMGVTFADVGGLIGGIAYWLIAVWENFKIAQNNINEQVKAFFINSWGAIKYAVSSSAVDMAKSVLNFALNGAKGVENFAYGASQAIAGFVNSGIDSINKLIDKLNSLKFTAPDWLPEIGGKTFSLNISQISGRAVALKQTGLSDSISGLINGLPAISQPETYTPQLQEYKDTSQAFKQGQEAGKAWTTSKLDDLAKAWKDLKDLNLKQFNQTKDNSDLYGTANTAQQTVPSSGGTGGSGGTGIGSSGNALKDIAKNTKGIEDNTAGTLDSLNRSDDDLTFIREVAKRKSIEELGLGNITINMENNFNGTSDTSNWDGFITRMTSEIETAISRNTRGVKTA